MTDFSLQQGILFVLIGPGGVGKNTMMRRVVTDLPDLHKLATATTRPIRPDEIEDVSHYFVSPAEFRQMITDGALLEHQEVTKDKYYGIIRARVDERLDAGEDLIADIEVLGAKIIRDTYPQRSVLIFVSVPGETPETKLAVLRERMEQREETAEHIEERLERARTLELPFADTCDYVIVNENNQQEKAIAELKQIIEYERSQRRVVLEPQEA